MTLDLTGADAPQTRSQRFERGNPVAIRSIRSFAGRGRAVGFAVAGVVVADDDDVAVVATVPGSDMRTRAGKGQGPNGRQIPDETWDGGYDERAWRGDVVVRVHRRGEEWSVWRWHDGRAWSTHWYGNLEAPWRRTPLGFDTQDWALDVVAAGAVGSGDWEVGLKDADELEWFADRGMVCRAEVAYIHAVGERLAERASAGTWPFDADWDSWLPDPRWAPTSLPANWRVVEG
jgi:hypothetical protein